MRDIIVFGASEQAEVAHYYFEEQRKHRVVAFVVDDAYHNADKFRGLPVVCLSQVTPMYPPEKFGAFVAVGYKNMNKLREQKYAELKRLGYKLVSYISPYCHCFAASIGENCFILEDNTIQPFVEIGNNVTLWSGNHIGHHSKIGDNSFVTSHVVVSGGVIVGRNCFIGVNATIRDHVIIGDETMIGASATIVKNTPAKSVFRAPKTEMLELTSDALKGI